MQDSRVNLAFDPGKNQDRNGESEASFLKMKMNLENYLEMTDDLWHSISSKLFVKRVRKNEVFIKAGEYCHHIFFINKGIVRFFYFSGDAEITSCFSFQNSFITALSSCILHKPSFENAQALMDTELVAIDYADMLKMFDQSHSIERLGRLLMENAYTELEGRMFSDFRTDAESKYRNLLKTGHPDIIKKIPLKLIASYLGVAPETLSRIRKKLTD